MTYLRYSLFFTICGLFSWLCLDAIQHFRAEKHHRDAHLQLQRGYVRLAINNLQRTTDLAPWEPHYQLQLAKAYEQAAKQFSNSHTKYSNLAIQTYESLIKKDPINPWYQARLGLIYYELQKNNPNNAIYKKLAHDYAQSASLNDPKNPLFSLHYGHLLYSYNKNELAKKEYLKTIQYDNDMLEAHFNLATIYTKENQSEKAMVHYKIIVNQLSIEEAKYKRKPDPINKMKIDQLQAARIHLADYYLSTKQVKLALEVINDIPVSADKYEKLAQYYEVINEYTKALDIYQQLNQRLKTEKYPSTLLQIKNK